MYGLEGVLTIFCIMAGSDVKQFVADGWTHYFLIIVTGLDAAQEILQADTQCSTFGKPHRQSLTYGVREHEQVHLLTDFTVIALLGFFQQNKILIQHLLLRKGDTIDTGHHLTVFLSTPISTGNGSQLNSLDRSCGHQVRATAQVGKCTLRISCDVAVFQFGNQLAFISFSTVTKHLQSICLGNVLSDNRFFLSHQFSHLFLNGRQVSFLDSRFTRVHIIVETVFDSRTYTELDARIEFLQSFGQQVGTGMPKGMLTLLILPFIKNHFSVLHDRTPQIINFSVHATSQHVLCQSRTDAFCNLQSRYSFVIFTNRAVWKCYLYHSLYVYFIFQNAKIANSF